MNFTDKDFKIGDIVSLYDVDCFCGYCDDKKVRDKLNGVYYVDCIRSSYNSSSPEPYLVIKMRDVDGVKFVKTIDAIASSLKYHSKMIAILKEIKA